MTLSFSTKRLVSVGEAMVELAPDGPALYRQGFAGDTFNTIWHIAQLLRDKAECGFVTRLGTDGFSERFVCEMITDGLDCAGILRSADREMGLYLIELDGVERSFHYWRKGSAASRLAEDLPALGAALSNAGLVHVSGITLAILGDDGRENLFACLARARQAGSVISFDPNVRPRLWTSQDACRESITRMLSLTDIALPSFDDEATLWGDATPSDTVVRMARQGVAEIVVKDGAGPVHAWRDGHELKIATPAVENIRDTTGAGDAFNAGYLAARFLGVDIAGSVATGQRLSGKVIGCLGARADIQSLEAVRNDLLFAD